MLERYTNGFQEVVLGPPDLWRIDGSKSVNRTAATTYEKEGGREGGGGVGGGSVSYYLPESCNEAGRKV